MSSRYRSRIRAAAAGRSGSDDPGSRGSFGDLGPGSLAVQEWTAAGLALPYLDRLRSDRLARFRVVMHSFGYGAAVLTDPINVRYATNSTNMSVWGLHNQAQYAFIALEGPVVLFDFHGRAHLSAHQPLVDEIRHETKRPL